MKPRTRRPDRGPALRNSTTRRSEGGFTLIELLISIALMMILIMAITMIFVNTTETVAVQEARMTVYTNARYAMDVLENDLLGCFSVTTPLQQNQGAGGGSGGNPGGGSSVGPTGPSFQRMWMQNGVITSPSMYPQAMNGAHHDRPGDSMSFRTTSTVGDSIMTCQVTYELIPGDKAVDPSGGTDLPGDKSHSVTVRSERPLFTLVRRVRVPSEQNNPGAGGGAMVEPKFDQLPKIKDRSGTITTVVDQELCHYVVGFNLEYMSNNRTFSQLDPSPCPKADPLGDGAGANDTSTPYRIPAIRVTIRIVEDIGERQERTIQKIMWIPQH